MQETFDQIFFIEISAVAVSCMTTAVAVSFHSMMVILNSAGQGG